MPSHYQLPPVSPLSPHQLPPPPPPATHRSVLLDLLVVGDDLPDAVDEAALVVGDEAHEYSLLGRIEQHQHSHFTGRGGVGEVDAAGLRGGPQEQIKALTWSVIIVWGLSLGMLPTAELCCPIKI